MRYAGLLDSAFAAWITRKAVSNRRIGYLKEAVDQALTLRGRSDFAERAAYVNSYVKW